MARHALLGLLALAALLAVTLVDLAPPAPLAADAPAGSFSAVRAHEHLQIIARAPHPVGSAEHARVRDHLIAELRELGLDVRVQEGVGVLPLDDYDDAVPMGRMRTIVATRPGTDPTGKVVLAAHYDSVAASPGASDDGAGVATILEVARALPDKARNDVVFLLTDGEEDGLLGAEAFTRKGFPGEGTVVVLNNEARGNRGTVQTFRTSPGAAPLMSLYGSVAPHPSADSAFAAVMSVLPNNTDFHAFGRAGWLGIDSAFVGGGAYYHSPLDDPAHLDQGSLQQMGANSLALTRALAVTDLASMKSGDELVYFTVPGLLVRYPAWLEPVVAGAALVLAGVLVRVLRRRTGSRPPSRDGTASTSHKPEHGTASAPHTPDHKTASVPRTFAAAGLAFVLVAVTAAAGYGLWPLLQLIRPEYAGMLAGDPYRPWLYQAGLLVVTLALVLAVRRFAVHGASSVLLVALLGVLFAVLSPGGSHTLTWPALFAAAGWLVARRVRGDGRQVLALTLGSTPAVMLLGGTAVGSLDIGLQFGGVLAAPHFALMLLLLLPLIDRVRVRGLPVAAAVTAVGLIVAGLAVDRFDAEHPRQVRLAYAMDEGSGQAVWGRLTDEAGNDGKRWFGQDGWATEPAPKAAVLRAPALDVLKDESAAGRRTLTLRLTPAGTPLVGLSVESRLGPLVVDGRELRTGNGFTYHAPSGPLEVTLVVRAGETTRVRVFGRGYDLSVVPGYEPPAETAVMGPQATVFREVTV
ncbi:M28 family peptidase [Nonomuraea sp. KC401]|uniref:M28 family peptidase n=1 Tax=unclassified Nonomuraea TaxID=2593643 RepID=UPI0010FEB892|nr:MULTISPECIES: M28 family peptidase [unclassified Nonomuraea]NBE94053.1 M28 family peptidase [Nonomuraea sp. K271]TLF74543.1 M28 family peptidase [Nonomuraea sp. KC401]